MFGSNMQKNGKGKRQKQLDKAAQHEREQLGAFENRPLSTSLQTNMELIKKELGESQDIIFRRLSLYGKDENEIMLVYVQGMVDDERMNEFVIQPLLGESRSVAVEALRTPTLEGIKKNLLAVGIINDIEDWKLLFQKLFLGYTVILMEGAEQALAANIVGGERRGIEEPKTEMAIRGPREGFTESIRINSSMIRRKIRSPKLWLEQWTIGEVSQTPVSIMYIKGLADEDVLSDLRSRLEAIQIDGVLESGYIEELITDQRWSPFPTALNVERPDAVAGNLLEGRIAILVDGTPFDHSRYSEFVLSGIRGLLSALRYCDVSTHAPLCVISYRVADAFHLRGDCWLSSGDDSDPASA
jgi:spore germination protein KA